MPKKLFFWRKKLWLYIHSRCKRRVRPYPSSRYQQSSHRVSKRRKTQMRKALVFCIQSQQAKIASRPADIYSNSWRKSRHARQVYFRTAQRKIKSHHGILWFQASNLRDNGCRKWRSLQFNQAHLRKRPETHPIVYQNPTSNRYNNVGGVGGTNKFQLDLVCNN